MQELRFGVIADPVARLEALEKLINNFKLRISGWEE
jgi:hypothetical protein